MQVKATWRTLAKVTTLARVTTLTITTPAVAALAIAAFAIALPAPARAEAAPIRVVFAGDIMLDETPGKVIRSGRDPFRAFASILDSADISIGNLESAVGRSGIREDKPYTFLARPEVVPVLKRHFSAVSLANNHSADFGTKTFSDMLDLFDRRSLRYFGGGRNLVDAHRPALFDIRGTRLAILGYSEFFPRSFEALEDRPGVAWSEDDYVAHDIAQARSLHKADYVIVFPHWGIEQNKQASSRQVALAHLMIDSGADAVVGGHPHVTQNVEVYKGKPIFYSIGNFVFDGFDDNESNTGWVVRLSFGQSGLLDPEVFEARLDRQGVPRAGPRQLIDLDSR